MFRNIFKSWLADENVLMRTYSGHLERVSFNKNAFMGYSSSDHGPDGIRDIRGTLGRYLWNARLSQ